MSQDAVARTDRDNERYRCLLCQLFARQYRPDAARAKLARDYAYNNRKMINEAFDRGVTKADVLNALRLGFDTASPGHNCIQE